MKQKITFDEFIDELPTELKYNGYEQKESDELPAHLRQVGGDHYKKMKIQPLEYAMANNLGPAETLCLRYISRWRDKGGIEDLEKAKHCIEMLIEFEKNAD